MSQKIPKLWFDSKIHFMYQFCEDNYKIGFCDVLKNDWYIPGDCRINWIILYIHIYTQFMGN